MSSIQNNEDVNDDDFLSGDNESKAYPNNQNNPNEGYNKQLSPKGNANIGGDESEYETSVGDEDSFNYDTPENDETGLNESTDFDSEEQEKSNNETRYNSPTRNGSHRNHYM
ncbi:hypothetical protein [Flavobacterium sp.]|uniref:hypothetical protein n=1 Tax=Flavobacterium sp. TaxID=239 RepID=UPI0025EB0B60|nr:hypothetical protein [Flavobacterium sp.]